MPVFEFGEDVIAWPKVAEILPELAEIRPKEVDIWPRVTDRDGLSG